MINTIFVADIIIDLALKFVVLFWCSIPFLIVIWGLHSFWLIARDGKKEKRCRCLLKGTVIDERTVTLGTHGNKSTYWKPRFGYTFNGRDYTAETPLCTREKRFAAGGEVDIYIDEKHPEVFWIPGEYKELNKARKQGGIILLLVGGALIIGWGSAFIFLK